MRATVFIDGSNLYHRLKSLIDDKSMSLLDFDYRKFSEWLCKENKLQEIRYYVGVIKRQKNNKKSEIMYANQQRLFRKLQQQNIEIILGHLIQHQDKTYHEKGVDVRLAIEMIKLARQNKYELAILVSSDTDLVPAVEEIKSMDKKVLYVCTAKRQSFGLSKIANDVLLLRKEDIIKFFGK